MNVDEINAVSASHYALDRDTPAKTWFYAAPSHAATFRALKIDPADPAAWYATAPFRLAKIDGKAMILVAWPAPKLLGELPEDWLDIETVLAWDPVKGTVEVMGDVEPQLVGEFPDTGTGKLFGTPFAFFRAWAEERAQLFTTFVAARAAHWLSNPAETATPGMLIVGDLKRMRLPVHDLPRGLECIGVDPREINAAIQRTARLPRAHGVTDEIRRAA